VNGRAAISAVVVVSAIFFAIRLGIVLLAKEAVPPPSPVVVNRSPSSPAYQPVSPEQAKRDAQAKLMMLASEARAAHETQTATAAYEAERAVERGECPVAESVLGRVADGIAPESSLKGAAESAARAVDAYCAMVKD
jgi:hypothetical protein